jgi:hypothetical protein
MYLTTFLFPGFLPNKLMLTVCKKLWDTPVLLSLLPGILVNQLCKRTPIERTPAFRHTR